MSLVLPTLSAAQSLQLSLGEEGCDSYLYHDDDGFHVLYWYEWCHRHIDEDADQELPI